MCLRGTWTSVHNHPPSPLHHITCPRHTSGPFAASQGQHHIYIHTPYTVMFSQRQNLQGSRTRMSNPCFLLRYHTLGRRAVHLWFGVMARITLGSQENKMLLGNNGIFCLLSLLTPFIYTRDQESLAAHCQGHLATAIHRTMKFSS